MRGKLTKVRNIKFCRLIFQNVGKKVTLLRCSVRSKKISCHASVSQVGDTFTRGTHQHIHPGDQKITLKAEISAKVRRILFLEYELALIHIFNCSSYAKALP